MAFDPTSAFLDDDTQPAAKGAFDPSTAAFDASTATEDFEADQGVLGTLKEGTKSAARAIGSTANTYTGNADGVVDKAKAQQKAPKDYRLDNFYRDVEENTKASGEDPGLLDAIGNVGKAVWDSPAGAGLAMLEQLPNSVPTLAGGYAGMKGGAALGAVAGGPVGAGIGGVIGGLAGMFLGNAAIETGHKAMSAADDDQYTPEEMSQVKREGAIKGGVITGVDAVTLGLGGAVSGAMQRTTRSALEAATRKALVDQGVDVADEAAVLAARSNPQVSAAVRAAQESAVKATDTLKRRAAEAGTLLAMESAGEGLGEYLGELAATGEGNVTDAVLESLLSVGQSGAETAWNMTRKREQRGLWEEAAAIADPSLEQPAAAPVPGADPALDGSAPIDAAAPEAAPAVDTSMVQPTPTAENPAPVPVPRPDPNNGPLSAAASLLPPAGAPALSAGPLSDVAPAAEQAAGPVAEQQAPARTEGPLAEAPPADPQASTEPPATPSQRAILARRGVGPEQIEGLTRKQAGELIQQQNKTQTAGAPKPQQMGLQEPEAVEAELRDQLSYLERQAKSAGGWTPALSRERARLRTALEPFDQNPSAAPAAVDAPADAFKVGEQWQKGRTSYTIESVSPDGRLADAVFPGGKRHKVSLDAELANGWQRSGQQAGAAVEQATEPAVEADPIQGQDIDGDWMTFAEQSGTKQVPRAQMPQIKAEHRGAMVNFLNARGIEHQEETVAAASLKPTQGEFSRKKVEQAKAYTGGNRSILVSSDNHVLDGHHQWLAARESGDDVKIIRLGAPIDQLLSAAHEFPSSTTSEGGTVAPAPDKPSVEQVKAASKPKQEAMPTQAFRSTAGVGDILAVKERYSDDKFGVSWSSTHIASARSMEEAAAIAKAVAESGADNITDMRAVAANQMPVKDAAPAAPDAQPAEAAPVKWFASESKAQAHIAKKKLGGTHQVVKNGNKYEIRPLAEQQGDLIVQQPPAVEPTPAAEPAAEQVEGAAKAPLEIPEKAFADLLAEMEQGEDSIPVFVEPTKTVRSEDRAKGAGEMTVEQAQALVAEWEAHAKAQGKSRVNAGKVVLSLFDTSGEWSQPWLDAGYEVHRFDIQDGMDINDFSVEYLTEQLGIERADIILAAPPCTDFSSSGAHAWKKKDADGRTAASVELVRQTLRTVELFRPSSWALENPVGRIQKLTGLPKPAMTFQPNNFGDPYTKRTLLWGDFNTELPLANVAPTEGSKITNGLAGKDKYGRSLTPKGFAYAYFMANNLADMSAADRLAAEFKGFPRAEFQAATDAGMTEAAIRAAIEDSYNDQDIEAAREDLRNAIPTPPEPTKAPEPEAAPESTSIAVRSIRAGKQLALALEAIGFTKIEGTNGMKHAVEGAGRAATTSVRVIRTDDQIQFQVASTTTSMQDGRMKAAAPGMTETFDSMDEAVALAAQWQEVNRKWVREGMSSTAELPSDEALALKSRHTKLDKAMDLLSDKQIEDLYRRSGLAGAHTPVEQKRAILKMEHPDDIEPLMNAKPAPATVPIEDARKADKLRQVRKMGREAYDAGEERTPPAWMGEGDLADAWLVGFGDGIAANVQRNMDARKEQEKAAAPDLAQQLAGMSNAALSSLIDDIAAEDAQVADTAKPAPKRKRKTQPKAKDATPKPRSTTSPAESADETDAADVERTAGEIAKSFGYNVSSAGMEAIKGLTELFGGSGRLSSGLTFDEETYAKAKPHFQAMLRDAQAAGHDLAQFVRTVLQSFGTGVKPYIIRYANDLRDEVAQPQENTNGTDSTQSAVDRADQAGVPAPAGGRGRDTQPGSAQADTGRVAAGESETVGEPVQGGADDAAGLRAPGTDVAGGERAAAPGRAADGRPRAGRKEPSDAGAGSAERADRSPSVTATKAPSEVSPGNPGPGNFHVADPLKIVGGGQVARFDKNRAAIELYNELRAEGRPATREEQEVLAGYTGWGSFGQELFQGSWARPAPKSGWEARDAWLRDNLGQKEWEGLQRSITNAHYTDPPTVLAMWEMVKRMGFQGGRVLEPSMGIGNFFGMMPADLKARSQLAGIELDPVTGGMAKLLYPDANIQVKGYQESKTPDGFYDLVIGNWPFEDTVIADRRYQRLNPYLHDYFFLKAVDQARAGGLVVGITSKGSMDKKSIGIRAELAKKAELVAAFRLPSGAFKEYAGTSVVTDIVILRKRPEPVRNIADAGWIESVDYQTPSGETVSINEYYVKNPQNVIGTIDFGHGTTFKRPGMIVHRPDNMTEQLERITQLAPEGAFQPERQADTISYIANHTADRENSLIRTKDGLFVVRGEYLAPANEVAKYVVKSEATTRAREDQLDRLIELRKQYAAVIEAQRSGDAKAERKALKASYEAFVAKHGPINESYGLSYLQRLDDPFYASLAALEVIQKDGEATIYKPSAIMSRATTRGALTIDSPSVADAYVLARNKNVNPTLEQVAELAKKPVGEVKAELLAKGAVFELPAGDVVPADIYLSGNVREKLRDAKAAVAEGLAQLQRNVDALEKVVPADVPYYKIEAQMGASWVSTSIYAEYVAHMLNLPTADGIDVSYSGGRWKIKLPNGVNNRAEASAGFGTREVSFSRLVNAAIANQTINVKRRDSDGTEYVDGEATKEVNGKIAEIRQRFGEWLWSDPERRGQVEREYNDARNAYATPAFDGSVLAFEGMALSLGNGPFDLRQHQVNAIWRALVMRRSLNAHEVGTGKTFTMGGIAVESRRYGIAKKPLILAHNANSKSVAAEIQMMYPAAKVLYIDNLSPETVDIKLRQIANDDWDAVVLPHSLINRLAFKEETLMEMAYEEIRELEIAAAEAAEEDGVTLTSDMLKDEDELAKLRSVTAKDLVKTRNKIINTIQKQAQRASKEGATAFEDLGIDMVLVDEGHEFKKPPFTTKMKMKGLQTDSSDRSIALAFLTKYIRSNNNGGNVHVFTGTPITNTLTEVFHQMRYIMQEEMEAAGVDQWDGWFGSFAREVTDVELSASAEYEAVTRLSAFINVPELRRMIGQYMDVVFADDMPEMQPRRSATGKTMADDSLTEAERAELLNGRTEQAKDRPYKKVIVDTADLTEEQKVEFAKIQGYARAWRNMGGKERKQAMSAGDPESPIIYENLASKASFDVRLNRGAELAGQEGQVADDPNSKASRVVRNVLEVYNSHPLATQVIFAQQGLSTTATKSVGPAGNKKKITYKTFSTMRDVVERLVQQGIPREQIAIVDGSTSKDKRKAIADAMNRAEIRVVIGSTQSLGVGVNMQRNLRAMHHMDAPWMPGDLEQRNGRGHRQGNQWNTVLEFRYLTDRLDGRRWQVLAIKQRFINAFLKSNDADRVIEGDAASDEESDILETFAEAAGDPRILVREKLKKKIEQLQSRERLHGQAVSDARRSLRITRERRDEKRDKLKALDDAGVVEAVQALTAATAGAGFTMTVDGTEYATRKEAEEAIAAFAEDNVRTGDNRAHPVGSFGGHALSLTWPHWADQPVITADINGTPISSRSLRLQSLETALRGYPDEIQKQRNEVVEAARTLTRLEQVANEPFHMAADLERVKKDYELLEQDLEQNPVPPPAWLRSGAPVDTEVTWKKKTFVVTGHRWNKDGWFVLAADAKGNVVIPYTEALDPQGLPIYEERTFEAPEVVTQDNPAGLTEADRVPADSDVRLSVGSRPSGATRVRFLDRRTVEQLAVEAVGEATARDRFVFTSYADLPEDVKAETARQGASPRSVQGLYSPKHNKTFIIDDRFTSADEAKGIMFHEHYVHFGLRAKYGLQLGPQLRQLLNGVGGLDGIRKLSREQGINLAAYERGILGNPEIAASKQPLILMEELLAHIGETTGSLRRLLEEFVGMLRAWARKANSKWFAELGVTDMAYVLREARNAAKRADKAAAGKPVLTLSAGGQTATSSFRKWFGNSRVVGADGRPMVMYHGSGADITEFKSGAQAKRGTNNGIYFTADPAYASRYAGVVTEDRAPNVTPVYLSIQSPLVIEATQPLWKRIAAAARGKDLRTSSMYIFDEQFAELRAQGYDGIINKAANEVVVFDPEQIKSAIGNNGDFDATNPDIRFRTADQTSSNAFRSWFGASKVVDKQGEPQVLYHGTASEFTVFENRSGNSTGHATSDLGYFMTSDQRSAEGYARNASDGMPGLARVMELYASIKNPYVATLEEMQAIENPLQARRWRAKLEQAGHDGMHIPAAKAWVAFNNYQIKSATDNVGTFDEFDADIRFRLGDFIGRRESFDVAASNAKRALKGRVSDLKPAMLGALPLNYLRDFAPQSMTALTAYMDEKRAMDADRNEMHTRYDAIAQRWLKLRWTDRKAEQRLADLMHAATLEGVDPSKPIKEAYTPEQKATYNRLRIQFQSLPAEHRAMFGEARDAYKQQISTLESVIEENIRKSAEYAKKRARRDRDADIQRAKDELVGDELDEALEAAEKRYNGRVASAEKGGSAKILLLRQKFESMRVDEPYFPLKRYGDYFVAMRDGDELVSFSMFESAADMEAAAAELRKTYPNLSVKVGRQSNKQELEGAVDPAFIADLQDVVSRMPNSKELSDQIYQMYLETMPDFSMRKGFIHRKKTAGFDRDAMRAFASSMFHSSYQIARLKHSLEMNELVEQVEDQAKAAKDPVDAMTIANELRKRHEWVMSPKSGKIAQHITSAAFVYQLGITPAAALVNTTQTWMMGIPILGARFGSETKAAAALTKASADFVQGRGHIEKRLEGQEAAAFAEFMRMGLIDKTQAHDLAGVGETGVEYNPVRHKVMGYISWAFHNAERYNREVTVMAAYRLGRESGLGHEAAIKEAAELTWTTHFDYSSGNRARFMQNDTAKVLLVFRQHSINMLSRLVIDLRGAMKGETPEVKRMAKRRLAGMFSMFGLFAGVMGIPGVMAILALLDLFDDDDDPWSTEDKMKRNLVDALGPDVAAVVLGGLPGTVSDLSLTERVGMGYLWFRPAGRELEGKDAYLYWMEQVLGAAPAMVSNAFTGMKMIGEGHVWRGIEAMMPKAIKDAMRAGRYTQEGVLTMDGTPLVDEVSTWNVIAQAMGFTPAHIAERYDTNRALKNAEQHILTERRSILNRYAMAVKQGDTEMRGKLLERIRAFNKRYPQYPITGRTISQSLKARAQRQAGAEGGIVLNRRLEFLREQL